MSDNIIKLNQELIHTELKGLVKNSVEEILNAMLDVEADRLLNAERYAHRKKRTKKQSTDKLCGPFFYVACFFHEAGTGSHI